ncbi:MAG: transposase [Proteobacteria bacterium]|nr:transposase [Pseudomonadota bacterium]
MTQPSSFADLNHSHEKRRTRREAFLSEMEGVIPWQVLLLHIEPHYPKSRRWGRQPMAALEQFRIYCLQNWFSLSGRQMEDALYEIESMRSFAGFGGVTGALPDERPRY